MSRVLLGLVAALVWAGITAGAIFIVTPLDVQALEASAQRELERTLRVVADAAARDQGRLLDRTTDASVALGLGAALDRLTPQTVAPPPGRKQKKKDLPETLTPEAAIDLISDLEQQLDDALRENGLQIALLDRKGQVVLSIGDAFPLGAEMRNAPLVQDALYGLARLGTDTIGKTKALIAICPTLGKDGASNGALMVARPVDDAACADIAAKTGVASLALGSLCSTGLLKGKATVAGLSIMPLPLDSDLPLLFVDPARIGVTVLTGPQTVPLLGAVVSVGIDERPVYHGLIERQKQIAQVVLGSLIPLLLMLVLAGVLAARPAHAIANHLALVHQGGKPTPLQEHKFGGGFKRIVKNLNIVLEKQQPRGAPALQPISALLQTQEEPDLRFESASPGSLQSSAVGNERTVQRKVDPSQLQALREAAKTTPPAAPVAPLPPLDLGNKKDAPLGGLFDEAPERKVEKPVLPKPQPPPPPAVSALPPLPDLSADPRPPVSSSINGVSDTEADSALKDLNLGGGMHPPVSPDTPWGNEEKTMIGVPSSMSFTVDPDEAHFREVFNQFLKIRAECNEPVDSLTYDKFVEKLKKSREQVMQKQNTRSVRFQVYVKDGKAALKAVAGR